MTLYQSFRNYLEKKGVSIDQNSEQGNMLLFKYESLSYVFYFDFHYPHYFRLMLPYISSYQNIDENALNKNALELSGEYKVAKLFIVENRLWASFEQLILDPDVDNTEIFETGMRILYYIYQSISKFVEESRSNSNT